MNLLKNQSVLLSERKISRWPTSMKLLTENNYFANEVSYWESIAANNTLPKMAINIKENIVANINSIQVTLCKEKTNCFIRNSLFSLESIIITVCMVSLASEFYKNNQALMFIEGHGRETMNKANFEEPSGDIGWFTSLFPFYENFSNLNLIDSLYKVVNNLRSIPHKGAGFMWLKYYGAKEIKEKFKRIFSPTPYITFNYLGIWDYSKKNFFRKSSDLIGFSFDPVNERSELLYFSSIVIEGELRLTIRYSNKTIDDEIIKALIVSIESKFSQIYDFLKTKDEEINAR
jgi:non-ribosomal peptide synthase protein (TIGR01720 family)